MVGGKASPFLIPRASTLKVSWPRPLPRPAMVISTRRDKRHTHAQIGSKLQFTGDKHTDTVTLLQQNHLINVIHHDFLHLTALQVTSSLVLYFQQMTSHREL